MTNPVSRMPNSAKKSRKLAAIYGVRRATTPQTSEVPRVATCSPFDGLGPLARHGLQTRVRHCLRRHHRGGRLPRQKWYNKCHIISISYHVCGKQFCPTRLVQGSAERRVPGLVNFVPALSYHSCLPCLQDSRIPGPTCRTLENF